MRFADIPAQEAAKLAFRHSLALGRPAHAILLKGPGGVGKLPLAIAMAQYLNCEQPADGDSCGACRQCRAMGGLAHPDVHFLLPMYARQHGGGAFSGDDFIEAFRERFSANPFITLDEWTSVLDAGNKQVMIPIQEIRTLKQKVGYKAYMGRQKVVILWRAEKMKTDAANALLKLLEEPPDDTTLILTAEFANQLLPTITSRCQSYSVRALPRAEVMAFLTERRQISPEAAEEVAILAEGSPGLALELLQHARERFSELFIEWMRLCYDGKVEGLATWADLFAKQSREQQKLFMIYALHKLRDTLCFICEAPQLALATTKEKLFLQRFSAYLTPDALDSIYHLIEDTNRFLARNAHAQLTLMNTSLKVHAALRPSV